MFDSSVYSNFMIGCPVLSYEFIIYEPPLTVDTGCIPSSLASDACRTLVVPTDTIDDMFFYIDI